MPFRQRQNLQLARIFGIRIGVSVSWFFVLFFLIYWLGAKYFPPMLEASSTTSYLVAVAAALGYFLSLILHELGHALVARRLGIGIAGIDLWFFGGLSKMRREPATPGEEFKIAAAGPAVTLLLLIICAAIGVALSSGHRLHRIADPGRLHHHSRAGSHRLAGVRQRGPLLLQRAARLPARRRAHRPRGDLAHERGPQPRDGLRPGAPDRDWPCSSASPGCSICSRATRPSAC